MCYLLLFIYLILYTFSSTTLLAQERQINRFALLIGNQAYSGEIKALKNPHNDVNLIAGALKKVGFTNITILKDATRVQMLEAFDNFTEKVQNAGPNTVSFFYYSGHGAADRSHTNYLIPVNVRQLSSKTSWYSSVKLQQIIDRLNKRAPDATHYVIFDACRNTLRLRAPGSKKAIVQPKGFEAIGSIPGGMLIAYATEQGELASDEGEGSGPYARVLADYLVRPNMEAVLMFRRMHKDLPSRIKQKPWLRFGGNLAEFYFAGRGATGTIDPDGELWNVVRNSSSVQPFRRYIRAFPNGRYTETARLQISRLEQSKYAHGYKFNDCQNANWCPRMIVIKGGTFEMGSANKNNPKSEQPAHNVKIEKFAAGRYEVSVKEYLACVDAGKCRAPEWLEKGNKYNINTGLYDHYKKLGKSLSQSSSPIVGISWDDAQSYVKWLSSETEQQYRLLGEAEWEYAARGGEDTKYWWGDTISKGQANYGYLKKLAPVDSYKANPFGLYNVHGNVWEWVGDCWHGNYKGAPTSGWPAWLEADGGNCKKRVSRGGSWVSDPELLRSRYRDWSDRDFRNWYRGFRVARALTSR